jgi:hypothetical protein
LEITLIPTGENEQSQDVTLITKYSSKFRVKLTISIGDFTICFGCFLFVADDPATSTMAS